MQVSFLDAQGVSTRFYHAGKGAPVILLHGVGVAADSWICNIEGLARHSYVVAPDLLGSGFTPPGPYSGGGPPIPYLVQHLCSIIDGLGFSRTSIVGSSLGALVAAHFALEHPERIEKLVFVNSGSLLGTDRELMRRGIDNSRKNGRTAYQNATLESCRARMSNIFVDVSTVPEGMLLMQLTAYALPWALTSYEDRMNGLLADLDQSSSFVIGNRLNELAMPTMVVWGREDPRGNFETAMQDFRRLPNVKIQIFENCGHMPHIEAPEKFNSVVGEFLVGAPGRS